MIEAESAAPDFGAQLVEGLLGRDAGRGRRANPFGAWEQGVGRIPEGALGRQEQEGIGSDGEGGGGFDRVGAADLRLADSQQSFFFAKIHLDTPALEVGFDDRPRIEVRVGAEQERRLAIEQLGALAQAISEGSDDDQLQGLMGAGGAPHQSGAAFEAQGMRDIVVQEGQGLPGGIVGADLFGSGSGRTVAEAPAARFLRLRIRLEPQLGILADPADGGGMVGQVFEDGLIGVAAVEGHQEKARGGGGIGVEGGAQIADLFDGALAEAGGAHFHAVLLLLAGRGFFRRFGRSGSMAKGDGEQAAGAAGGRESEGNLEKTLGAHEIGLKVRPQGIAAPSHAGSAQAGAAQQRIIEDSADGSAGGEGAHHGAPHHREEVLDAQTGVGKEPVTGGPVTKLQAASGEQTGHGVASQTQQGAQREGLGVRGDAALTEAGEGLTPELFEFGEDTGRVFFSTEAGGAARRKANSPLSSTNHSTLSPRENSMAWARAEGKLMYHCSLAWRLISWTLVGKPMGKPPFVI